MSHAATPSVSTATPSASLADWYFDFASPFSYLQLERFGELPADLTVTLHPVVLGALLSHWQTRGPAEIPGKRTLTYRMAQFRAEQAGIPFRMPPVHPFHPIRILRLAVALGATFDVVQTIFRFIWREGRDVVSPDGWRDLCTRLGAEDADARVEDPAVKQALRANTEAAIAAGVFGVPTFVRQGELFWGDDATALFVHCLKHPEWLDSAEVRRIGALPVGVERAR
ncbi:2-hydroxychromene-2-carboxylate isomerase [Pandoraea terrae]|uniref:2-hydroxychromene-2-carboxylate isomerase n=1 Tax=Pandoraea terrae TaxID=1537710 RepID=A0A5E4TRE1_9BURK|nr:2-hydroxychromene-2-carboxylate isomerase [Pandoraea terrae]VVD90435.1 2-hydroxychromene-2-carboxylate isomerase [Pandoraea terrae]